MWRASRALDIQNTSIQRGTCLRGGILAMYLASHRNIVDSYYTEHVGTSPNSSMYPTFLISMGIPNSAEQNGDFNIVPFKRISLT